MTDKVHHEHWCKCGRWGSFGKTDAKGNQVWTCGKDGCAKAKEEKAA